jgi:hypothetical protein
MASDTLVSRAAGIRSSVPYALRYRSTAALCAAIARATPKSISRFVDMARHTYLIGLPAPRLRMLSGKRCRRYWAATAFGASFPRKPQRPGLGSVVPGKFSGVASSHCWGVP